MVHVILVVFPHIDKFLVSMRFSKDEHFERVRIISVCEHRAVRIINFEGCKMLQVDIDCLDTMRVTKKIV